MDFQCENPMKLLKSSSRDPAFNLALEEFVFSRYRSKDLLLMLYINNPAIVVGKHQNVFKEVSLRETERLDMAIYRRITGGGAVYHDQGNLNFSFIESGLRVSDRNYDKYLNLVLKALKSKGINAVINDRKGLEDSGSKFSGTAMRVERDRLICHGTLLFDSDLTRLSDTLHVNHGNIETRATRSKQARVVNLKPSIGIETIDAFSEEFAKALNADGSPALIDEYDLQQVHRLSDRKYRNWDWNIGKASSCEIKTEVRIEARSVSLTLSIKNGYINSSLSLEGGYDLSFLEGVAFWPTAIQDRIEKSLSLSAEMSKQAAFSIFNFS